MAFIKLLIQLIASLIPNSIKHIALIASSLCILFNTGNAQVTLNSNIIKGPRPVIHLNQIPNSAFEQGKISVKFLPAFASQFTMPLDKDADGNILFHIPSIDLLNKKYQVSSTENIFAIPFSNKFTIQLHHSWGLDLWYELHFPDDVDVKQIIADYQSTKAFEVVEPVYKKVLMDSLSNPNDSAFSYQWNFNNTGLFGGIQGKDIHMLDAWQIETGKPQVIVSVHDYGIQLDHPDLAQNIATGLSYNFVDNSTNITPGNHGTHCAGTIAAVNNNGIGICGIAGGDGTSSSGARLMSCEIYSPSGTSASSKGFQSSYVYAADNGACISSNSWGYSYYGAYEISLLDAIDYFIANAGGNVMQGGIVVFSAGNTPQPVKTYPGAYEKVICVAATNNQDRKASYSTYGSWVNVSAPGGENGGRTDILSTNAYSGYFYDHGTSMACPHVSGVAALVASKLMGRVSASDVRDIILSTTDNIDSLNPSFVGMIGTGRLNAYKALVKAQALYNGKYIAPVTSFNTTFSCGQFNLSWKENAANNNVVVAYNTNPIGSLVDGMQYNTGSNIVGGGTVIYKGNDSTFTMPLQDTSSFHYFKIWSVNDSNQYSFGTAADIVSRPLVLNSGKSVMNQPFDFPPLFPTIEWQSINPDNDITWTHTAEDAVYGIGAGDAYSMGMYNYQDNPVAGRSDILTTPLLNVKNTDSITLSFWRSYRYRETSLPYTDTLQVVVSTDCGNTFTPVVQWAGKGLATVPDTPDSEWKPLSIDEWKQETIDLSSFKNNNLIIIGFRCVNGKGNNVFIDNINVDVRHKQDAALNAIINPTGTLCNEQSIVPQIQIQNRGNNTLNSLQVNYSIDGGTIEIKPFTGSILTDSFATISFNAINIAYGTHTIKAYTSLPNGMADGFTLNDTMQLTFTIAAPSNFPLTEGFEDTTFPPAGWQIEQTPIDNITWQRTTNAGYNSTASAMINNFSYNSIYGNADDLISPLLTVTNESTDTVFFYFNLAYASLENTSINVPFDTLEVDYTKDCGNTWNMVYKKWGKSLQTINQTTGYTTAFIPNSNQWRTDSINLSGLLNKGDQVRFRFRNTENSGNNLYLDNINLYFKPPALGLIENGYAIYPNPFNQTITIQHVQPPTTLKHINLYDISGRKVYSIDCLNEPTYFQLSLPPLPKGMYNIQLIYSNKVANRLLIKN